MKVTLKKSKKIAARPFFTMPGPVGDKPTGPGWEREDALEHGWWVNAAQGLLYNDQRSLRTAGVIM